MCSIFYPKRSPLYWAVQTGNFNIKLIYLNFEINAQKSNKFTLNKSEKENSKIEMVIERHTYIHSRQQKTNLTPHVLNCSLAYAMFCSYINRVKLVSSSFWSCKLRKIVTGGIFVNFERLWDCEITRPSFELNKQSENSFLFDVQFFHDSSIKFN